ncbi:hypothetical protein CWI38_0645p0020 [Hamiltosporidium tvaerminnensis]|uniref:Uncharacterized protein n=1 Tax=Hamiltosporidium tvaerminnensis TaxID=1176355 RepID=A0A4Q9LYE9_9MICR|nr:hypothetical protein CWI38_0649p0020 [Hamiltosporidium tvaerminnensis]TBU12745.1 hypothetical protein CWI38_0645p0020 [Hamiltosporidium tvaerminnensis]
MIFIFYCFLNKNLVKCAHLSDILDTSVDQNKERSGIGPFNEVSTVNIDEASDKIRDYEENPMITDKTLPEGMTSMPSVEFGKNITLLMKKTDIQEEKDNTSDILNSADYVASGSSIKPKCNYSPETCEAIEFLSRNLIMVIFGDGKQLTKTGEDEECQCTGHLDTKEEEGNADDISVGKDRSIKSKKAEKILKKNEGGFPDLAEILNKIEELKVSRESETSEYQGEDVYEKIIGEGENDCYERNNESEKTEEECSSTNEKDDSEEIEGPEEKPQTFFDWIYSFFFRLGSFFGFN